jgi:hypothetical protein
MDRIALHAFMVRHRFGVVSSISGDDCRRARVCLPCDFLRLIKCRDARIGNRMTDRRRSACRRLPRHVNEGCALHEG